jgi:hypothetical protein
MNVQNLEHGEISIIKFTMKTTKKIAFAVPVLAFSLLLTSHAPAATNEPKQTIQQFFEAVEKNDVDRSLKTLFDGTDMTIDGQKEINAGIKKAISTLGTPARFDLVSEIPKGPVVVEFIYTQSFAARPLFWKFFAYQSSQRWIIIDADFNTKASLLD